MGWRIPSLFKSSDFLCNQLRLSNLARVHHIHLAMTTKPLQLIKASFTLYKDYDILFFYFSQQYSAKQKCYFTSKIGPYKIDIFKSCPRILLRNLPSHQLLNKMQKVCCLKFFTSILLLKFESFNRKYLDICVFNAFKSKTRLVLKCKVKEC